ncbi:hypothetical protein M8A51_22620 [Schlegelella sp. S2-27]|uniref:NfeD-like C-terminal, partner-binding n=1 Tax=Caldimonas mangrovi TaxID=2944811 RepID=A0ABT0YUA3_9BURK|nr:hypothetical protein [Caldimonas mangrovi]MCM5682332.1 hypothetical protein [Caldimonas mangrovi]
MNPWTGWALAIAALGVGWFGYGWQGLVFSITLVVFWLLLQFNKAVRVMRNAGSAPIGHIDSAVMLNAKLKPGMAMMEIVMLTRSLGQKVSDAPEQYRWTDTGGSRVTVEMRGGKLVEWTLWRPQAETA